MSQQRRYQDDIDLPLDAGARVRREHPARRADVAGLLRVIKQMHQRNARLSKEIVERDQRIEDLNAFSETVAHNLKGLLSLLVGYSGLLVDELPSEASSASDYAQHVLATSEKMNRLIEELLILAGVGDAEVARLPLDMAPIIAEAKRRLAPSIAQTGAALIHPDDWPIAMGHAAWVEEVWVNYISNALKYGGDPDAGIPPRVVLGWDRVEDAAIRFWVRDNGPGIAPEAQAQLFTPFTRLDTPRADGHGLGLSIVKRVVEKLGGEVGVESAPGEGARFFFTLTDA